MSIQIGVAGISPHLHDSQKSEALTKLEDIAARYNEGIDPVAGRVEIYSVGQSQRGAIGRSLEAAGISARASRKDTAYDLPSDGIDAILSWHMHQAGLVPLHNELDRLLEGSLFEPFDGTSFELSDNTLRRYRPSENPYPIKMIGYVVSTTEGEAIAILVSGGG